MFRSVRTEAIELKKALSLVVKLLTMQPGDCDEEEVKETEENSVLNVWEQEGEDSAFTTSQFTVEATDLVVSIV